MLSISNLQASYDGSRILRNVTFTVAPGEVVCLMGRNGVGKTTALKTIMGLVRADAGVVSLGATDLSSAAPDQRARAGIGYVPQGRDIFPGLSVIENLRIGALAQGRKLNGELDRVFALFPVLKDMTRRKGGVLSGGQQQQLAIGRALLTNPRILLLDEPTEGIQPNIIDQIGDTIRKLSTHGLSSDDPECEAQIAEAIRTLRQEGRLGILLVEQYLDFCLGVGDRFHIMDRGCIVAEGPIGDLTQDIVNSHLTV